MEKLAPPPLPDWLDAMLPFTRYAVRVGDYAMHVMEAGEGTPVLMLHGNPTWGFLYRKVAAALAGEKLRVIMPDLVGLGLSDKPTRASVHTLAFHAQQIGMLIDALDLDDLVLVGQDWGGPVGLRALADRADRLAGLVVLNTVVGPPRRGFRQTAFHRFAHAPLVADIVFRLFDFPQSSLARAQGDKASIQGDVARAYRYPLEGLRANAAPLALARMVPNTMEHPSVVELERCQALVESFEGPSAIVWGDRDPVLGRVRSHIERLMPNARVTRTRAGHFLQEEVPGEIADAVRFVAGLTTRA